MQAHKKEYLHELKEHHKSRENEIKKRLSEFRRMWNESDKKLFEELCFCTLTPQSKAIECDNAVKALAFSGLLFTGSPEQIEPFLHKIRFYKNKSRYIVYNRNLFAENGRICIKAFMHDSVRKLETSSFTEKSKGFLIREWLVSNVKGFGYKEASHFLRNVGQGEDLAILDRHILKNLKLHGVIGKVPDSIHRKKYFEIEKKMKEFSEITGIPLPELDLAFWSMETGKVFK